eukprot:118444_1
MSDHVSFDRIKTIKQSYKDIVFGYIRKCQDLLPQHVLYYQIPQPIQSTILLFYYSMLDSSILTDNECDILFSLFEKHNKFKELGYFEYELIYSSKRDGIGEIAFKKKSHNKKSILCFIESTEGNVFGGYTKRGWWNDENYGQQDDNAFIFSIRSNKNNPPAIFSSVKSSSAAIWNQDNYYCVFGGDCAFYVKQDGKTGNLNSKRCIYVKQDGKTGNLNYQKYPSDLYLTNENFGVECIEAFQLKKIH